MVGLNKTYDPHKRPTLNRADYAARLSSPDMSAGDMVRSEPCVDLPGIVKSLAWVDRAANALGAVGEEQAKPEQ